MRIPNYVIAGVLAVLLLVGLAAACGGGSAQAPSGGIEIDIDHHHAPTYHKPTPRIVQPVYKTPAKKFRSRKV
jgi:ABC-type glycerol-3-phosphate transport system substrate-binding protein